jgi:hypothetical protein
MEPDLGAAPLDIRDFSSFFLLLFAAPFFAGTGAAFCSRSCACASGANAKAAATTKMRL